MARRWLCIVLFAAFTPLSHAQSTHLAKCPQGEKSHIDNKGKTWCMDKEGRSYALESSPAMQTQRPNPIDASRGPANAPRTMRLCINLGCSILTWRGDHYDSADASGVVSATATLVHWGADSITLTAITLRPDSSGNIAKGVFTGKISETGEYAEGNDAWEAGSFKGNFPFQLTWGDAALIRTKAMRIDLSRPYTDTGLRVTAGETISVKARGAMTWYTGGCQYAACTVLTPAGIPCPINKIDTAPGLHCFSLIGKFGPNGPPFEVGESSIFRAASTDELFLGVNDGDYSGNTGLWAAWITIGPMNHSGNALTATPDRNFQTAPEGMDAYTGRTVDCNSEALAAASPETAFENGKQDYNSKDFTDGFCWVAKAVQGRVTDALLLYGLGYQMNARGLRDTHEAFSAFQKAADQGSVSGAFYTGRSYRLGYGTAPNAEQAQHWLNKASETPEGRAMVEGDHEQAVQQQAQQEQGALFLKLLFGVASFAFDEGTSGGNASVCSQNSMGNPVLQARQYEAGCKKSWEH